MTLTIIGALPLLGALLIGTVKKEQKTAIKQMALLTSILTAVAFAITAMRFEVDRPGFQFVESHSWLPTFGINYALGLDGISLILILMSVLLAPVVIVAGWHESEGGRWSAKTFYILILVLETMMIGVFAATDVFLFYVFFEEIGRAHV